jgi:geranylgeranyl diphosphate synthase type II
LFTEIFANEKTLIEQRLSQLITEHPSLPYADLFTAARYSLLPSAKRIRPLLLLATLQAFGLPAEIGIDPACSIEMIHTYSLIHDDLPCMDNDDYRRGQPSLHKAFSESHALLTGDFLLTYAFEVLSQAPKLSDRQKIALVQTLAEYAGSNGMIGGQVIDLLSESQTIDWPTLELMHDLKTASLITASLEFGAIIADVSSDDRAILQSMGKKIGIAFQIIDDLLDVTSSFSEMGKLAGSDEHNKKATATSILGILPSCNKIKDLCSEIEKELKLLSRPAPILSSLIKQLTHFRLLKPQHPKS